MDNIYKAVQLTIDSQNLALSKTPTHVYIANQYVDTNDTPLITAPFIIQKALENGTGVVDIVSSTIGSIYEVRLLCDAEVLISGYFYMPPMNVNFSELELYTSYPPRTPPVVNEFWQKTENFILEKTNTLLNFVQVFNAVSSMRLSLGYLEELATTKKSNLVSAINEVYKRYEGVGDLYEKNVEAGAGANGWIDTLVSAGENINQRQVNDGLSNVSDLLSIKNPRNGQRVYVKSVAAHYIYDSNLTATPNGVTIVGKWEMEDKGAYFASWFATPDVEEDQSLKLQEGLDYATSKGSSFIIDDTYWVKAKQSLLGTNSNAFLLRTNSVTAFTPKGHLKLITENASGYNMILARQIDNYILIRPKITGDRRTNKGGAGEWGYGLTIYESSNGYIEKPYIRDMWGDGLYIGKAWGTASNDVPTNITVIEPDIKGCRRNGIALTSWDNVRIVRPIVSNVGDYDGITGTFPKAAIDVEPEFAEGSPPARGINGIIEDPILLDSYAGFYFYGFPNDANFDLHVKGITTLKGINNTGAGFFHGGANCTGLIKIDHLNYLTAPYLAMALGWNKLSELKLLIERIDNPKQKNFEIRATQRGAFVGKKLGNVTINNINTSGFTVYVPPEDEEYLVDGYRFFISPDNKAGIGTWLNGTAAKVSGKDTYIQSGYCPAHAGWSTATDKMGNEIWLNTASNPAGDTQIYFNTFTDYRVLTIGLSNDTLNIGQGCNINGVKLTIDGVAKTRMHTKTRGGWIKFQNIEGKDTDILDSYGVWTFS